MTAAARKLAWCPAPVVGVLTVATMFVVLMFWGGLLFVPVALLKLLCPLPALRGSLGRVLEAIADGWVASNHHVFRTLHGQRQRVVFDAPLDRHRSWLVISNHQSWADILLLFDVLYGRAPLPRFFLKRQLIWLPLVGFICWALDMPFMTRAGKAAIAANPALAQRDLETTRRFCAKYRGRAITVVNYVEGTRFTPTKRDARGSPYRHLLVPKSAGFAFTLAAMGEQFAGLVDLTIVYAPPRDGRSLLWSFLCGEQREVRVRVTAEPLPPGLLCGDYGSDAAFRARFQQWMSARWTAKDEAIARSLA